MAHKFSNKSLQRLSTCHADLQLIAKEAIKHSKVDFTITCGHRAPQEQFKLYTKGRHFDGAVWKKLGATVTNVDGYERLSKHNYSRSQAFDFHIYVPGKPELIYDMYHIMFVVGVIETTASRLLAEGKITHKIRSGTNWDGDGELKYDQTFFDAPHIELI